MFKTSIVFGLAATALAAPAGLHKKTHDNGESRSYDCPGGYDLQGKQCILKEYHDQSLICPSGTKEIGDKCLSFTGLLKKCPEGYSSRGKTCTRPIMEPATPFCAEDFTLDGEQCTKEVMVRPYCPSESREDENGCSIYKAKLSECPEGYRASGKGCINTINHPKYPECRDGYELIKDQCVKQIDLPAYCPPGYTDTKMGCAKNAPRQSECPEGYTRTGKGCVNITKFPKVPTCSDEYTLEDNECVKHVPLRAYCPQGFNEDSETDEGCSFVEPKESECPDSFTRAGDSCKKIHRFPRVPVCSKEYTLEGNSCTKQVPIPSYCPAGYKQGKEGCVIYGNKLSKCPEGYSRTGKGCINIIRHEKHPECGKEFTLEGNSCIKYVPIPAFCPAGYKDGKEGCHKATPKLSKCPEGYNQSHKGCKRVTPVARVPSCDDGFSLEKEKCKKIIPVPSYSVCNQGVKIGDSCVTKSSATKEYTCSKGETLKGRTCVSVASFDCSTTKTRTVCEDNKPHTKGSYWLRSLNLKKEQTSYHSKNVCHEVEEVVPKTCTKSNTRSADGACPAGYEQSGKSCTATSSVPAEVITPAPRIISAEPKMVCPEGGCSWTEKADLEHFCPDAWYEAGDRCLQTTEKIQPEPRKVTLPAKMVCNAGTGLGCTDKEEAELEHFCPSSFTEIGDKCIKTAELIQPEPRTVTIPAKQVCSGGGKLTCIDIEEAELNYFCPRFTVEIRGRCLKLAALIRPRPRRVAIAPTMVCSGGDGFLCTTTDKAELDYFCADGYTMIGEKCVATAEKIQPAPRRIAIAPNMVCSAGTGSSCIEIEKAEKTYFCPRGTVEIRDKCVKILALIRPRPRTVTIAARFQCTDGFNLSGKRCLTTESSEYDEFCAPSYYRLGDKCAKSAEHLSICKLGVKTDKSCVVTKSAPPKVTIVRQCTKGEAGC